MGELGCMRLQYEIDSREVTPAMEASFWSLVTFNVAEAGGCWLWGGMSENGYGRFKAAGRRYAAHRLSYSIAYGNCPADLVVRHTCDNSLCVAPHHLVLGTDADNIADRDARGRTAVGSRGGGALLTEDKVIAIRADSRGASAIAAEHGVHKSTISKIRSRVNWRHVT